MIKVPRILRRAKTAAHGFTLVEILVGMSLLTLVFLLLASFSFTTSSRQGRILWQNQAEDLIEEEFERFRTLSAQGYFTDIISGERMSGGYKLSWEVADFTLDVNNTLIAADERSTRIKRVTVTVTANGEPSLPSITRSTMILVR